ncbi:hypothetical protein B4N89_13560 [Embleya scabrispora]|uniref:Uncharacterized protein n=1 Tax=Embleya scabrispora TaxID=159449 RepID=A0A1T3NY97_9ACTN|nr:hypothetical protein [Embleya scabrispora]OPC81826.1 hypothetical protein B4N89_13560 [Embleya scabrispora]
MAPPRIRHSIGDALRNVARARRLAIGPRDLAALTVAAADAVPDDTTVVPRPTAGSALTPKPHATPADARAIAHRIETTWNRT